MADFRALARQQPAVRHYIKHRKWVDRAGVIAYAPMLRTPVFTTDAAGFRRGILNGEPYDLNAAFSGNPYALVMGSSHVFGFGLDGDALTIPSQVAAHRGLPCLNISFPEAQLHTLYAVALRICAQAPRPPAFIALMPGGALTRFEFVRSCDPLFGVPDFQTTNADCPPPGSAQETAAYHALRAYLAFWIGEFEMLAARHGVAFVLHPEFTAFEKPALSDDERACGLTVAQSDADHLRFQTHRLRCADYRAFVIGLLRPATRVALCEAAELTYVDEYHYTADGAAVIAAAIARA
ncbi:hypothetical protein AN189_11225 [Loktanella sp. 3ANDIMAR09]|uniref:hypothetical protein n=1 Tax=Loktanella sp. 3ANDIMAR09 TaxID=1225657 RepID=UPI0006F69C1C|nr:hypothetical protein [Loktanella sp. 3ANDIMAR09]KQI68364.1 hypothetical protein AN189_11225 [Loktanella sp. 3ANDIMAR09]